MIIRQVETSSTIESKEAAMMAEINAWRDMAISLANKYPVDSQTFDYIDELLNTDWQDFVKNDHSREDN